MTTVKKYSSIIGIDPGTEQSAVVIFGDNLIIDKGILPNENLLNKLKEMPQDNSILIIEMCQSYGMAVGQSIFDTVFWSGRFSQVWEGNFVKVYRKDIKLHFCHSARAKDTNIKQALIDRFGEKGTKANPGILYGVSKDVWSALAVAVYYYDLLQSAKVPNFDNPQGV